EVRLFTLSNHLMGRWLQLAKKLAVERRQLETKQAWLGALTDLIGLAAYSGCLMLIASLISGSAVRELGPFTTPPHALQQLTCRIEQAMRSLAAVHEQSLYLADLYEFLELDVPTQAEWQEMEGRAAAPGRVSEATVTNGSIPE